LKILQISSAQTLGGGERHLADLANGLAQRGHDVYAALRPKSALMSELRDVSKDRITKLPLRNSFDAKSARDLAKLVGRLKIDIVAAHLARDYPLAAYAVRRNPDSRLIVTRHVLFPLNPLHRITLSKAARVIAVSQAVASQLRVDQVAPPEKIRVVLNGINVAGFRKAREEFDRANFLESWKLPADGLLVGTVGELNPLKGQEEFLRAAAKIVEELPNTNFVVAGIDHSAGSQHQRRLEQLIEKLRLMKHVKLVGWLEDLAQLYCGLDVFVSASHTESFGLAIAEAMASGTAVVATETAGARELIRSGETGLLVPIGDVNKLADAISDLLNDKLKRIGLASTAQEYASSSFGVERMIAETEEIYRAAIDENAR
jgi:glycosyltransferase involved in cell wall biosynthesis